MIAVVIWLYGQGSLQEPFSRLGTGIGFMLFAGLWAAHDWGPADALGWAAGCALAIAAHPLRPNALTAAVSASGVGLWVFLGLVLTFNTV